MNLNFHLKKNVPLKVLDLKNPNFETADREKT